MKLRRTLSALLSLLLCLLLLTGCTPAETPPVGDAASSPAAGGAAPLDEGPDDTPIRLEPAGEVIARYSRDETDHASMAEEDTRIVRLHYRRNDDFKNDRSCYEAWNVWAWDMANGGMGAAYDFTGCDDYGVWADLDLAVISEGRGTDKLGFIVRTDNWSKDPDGDRSIDVLPRTPGGIQDVYVRTAESTVFDKLENALQSLVSYAMLRDARTISVYFKPLSADFRPAVPRFSMSVNGEDYTAFTMGEYDPSLMRVDLTLADEIDLCDVVTIGYRFSPDWVNRVELMMTNYFNSEEFDARYYYDGDDLGVSFDSEEAPTATTFKVWAPTSSAMLLRLYRSGDYMTETEPAAEYPMEKGDKGVFSCTVGQDLDGMYYTYVVTNAKGVNEVVDPYARSAGVNGRRGMIVNFSRINAFFEGWEQDRSPFDGSPTDAVIYEAHVRDMTISPTSGVMKEIRGKFAGLAETGTTYKQGRVTVSTGLDHIRELGVTHVQLQPVYDFSSVDETRVSTEMSKDNYNWGYDPLNYNVLEGSYSYDPYDGRSRIMEFKSMIMAMHEVGLSVNLDVVYNHTSGSENSNFNLLVPYYYYRTKANGAFYNGSGCGNEIASERAMVNKFIRDSCRFWIEEYHISGFRFDLMGLIDNQTMIDIYRDCAALDPHIMIYGEPWTGGASKLKSGTSEAKLPEQTTVQESLAQDFFGGSGVMVGAFNDVIRNAIRGENSPGKGYVQGNTSGTAQIAMCLEGRFSKSTVKTQAIAPVQVLNYVSCHDNYTLYDQLVQTMNAERLPVAYTQAESLVFLSEGIPFLQEGEEFMRSKYDPESGKYDGNSYISGDFINAMDYSLKVEHLDTFDKFREMIAFRKAHDGLRLASREEVSARLTELQSESGTIQYRLDDMLIVHSLTGTKLELDGRWELLYSSQRAAGARLTGTFEVRGNESVVLRKAG